MKKLLTLAIIMIAVTIVSCKKEKPTNDNSEPPIVVVDSTLLPQLQTLYMRNISDTAAECVCKMLNWDSVALTEWGCCWSTTHNPTINDNHAQSWVIIGGVYGGFLTDLTPETTYYVRAYGQNSEGIGYGNEIEFVAENEEPHLNPWSPEPVNGHIPAEVLPDALADEIGKYMNIYSGNDPLVIDSMFVSNPHTLMHTTFDEPADTVYHELYVDFVIKEDKIDIIEWVWDNQIWIHRPVAFRDLYIIGSGNNFTTYYLEENTSYSSGYFKKATILSGTWDDANRCVRDFKIAEILVKTYGNPNLPPENSYRIVGDGDGVSEYFQIPN